MMIDSDGLFSVDSDEGLFSSFIYILYIKLHIKGSSLAFDGVKSSLLLQLLHRDQQKQYI